MFSVFGWLRKQAAQAVVDGVRDGLAAVADDGAGSAPPPDLAELRARLAAAVDVKALAAGPVAPEIPPAEAEGTGARKKK